MPNDNVTLWVLTVLNTNYKSTSHTKLCEKLEEIVNVFGEVEYKFNSFKVAKHSSEFVDGINSIKDELL